MRVEHWDRVKDLFQAALEQKPEQRSAYLAGACEDNVALQREVESLLLASERAEGFIETPALGGGVTWVEGATAKADRVLRIGPYRILCEIGRGGMAAVYLAVRDDGEYRKEVAIKVVQNAFASEFIVRRFRQERQILADLEHENIARLLDGGTTDDDLPYLVMEHVAGSPIDAYCDEHRLSLTERLRLFCEVCSAVGYAHQRLVIHRDLKPSNIFVTADGKPKLLDFGIAKLLDESDQARDRTVTGWRLMTPEYASPEQLRGELVGVPADIYALGVLLYHLVTGRSPYRRDTKRPHELARAICEDEPEIPSAVLRRAASPDRLDQRSNPRGERREVRSRRLAGDLDAIVMKALAKEPERRYASVEQFANDVGRYLDRLPISARRPALAHRAWKLMGRHGSGRLAAAGLLIAIVALTIVVANRSRDGGGPDRLDGRPMSLRNLTTLSGTVSGPAFSPDGNVIAFSWSGEANHATGRPGIYTVRLAGGSPFRLTTGLGGEEWPAWSPDGSHIAFVRRTGGRCGIFSIPALGGPERKLVDLRDDRYHWLAWSPDGKHLAFADRGSPEEPYVLSLLSLDTLERRPASSLHPRQSVLRFAFSPDGKTLALIALGLPGVDVSLLSLSDGKTRSIYSQREWIGGLAWTADGQALMLSLNQRGSRRLGRVSIAGGELELLPVAGEDAYYPAVSRRGDRLAFVRELSDADLWRVELNGPSGPGEPRPLVRSTRRDAEPRFSPDGKKIAFQSHRSGSLEIWASDADGSNQVQLTSLDGPHAMWPSWSRDGRHVLFWAGAMYVVRSVGGSPSRLNPGGTGGELPAWSTDGKWVYFAYGTNPNVWKVAAKGGEAVQVTRNGGGFFRESPDGRHLYYTKNDEPGIWRMPLPAGQETRVIEDFSQSLLDYWDVVDDGIYFADATTSPYPTIRFFSFATRRRSPVAMLAGPAVPWGGGLTVSPDRRSIVYAQSMYARSEIMLVDNFR